MDAVLAKALRDEAVACLSTLAGSSRRVLAEDIQDLANESVLITWAKLKKQESIEDPMRFVRGVARNLWKRRCESAAARKETLVDLGLLESAGPVRNYSNDIETEQDFYMVAGASNVEARTASVIRILTGRGRFASAMATDMLGISQAAMQKRITRARAIRCRVSMVDANSMIKDLGVRLIECFVYLLAIAKRYRDAPNGSPEHEIGRFAIARSLAFSSMLIQQLSPQYWTAGSLNTTPEVTLSCFVDSMTASNLGEFCRIYESYLSYRAMVATQSHVLTYFRSRSSGYDEVFAIHL